MIIPKPKANPSSTLRWFQSIKGREIELLSSNVGGGELGFADVHAVFKGNPHKPLLLSYEVSKNVANCLMFGICPTNWLNERFRTSKKIRPSASCTGISPVSLLLDKSSDSSWLNFPRDGGIRPMKALCDKLRICNELSTPIVLFLLVLALQDCCMKCQLKWK